MVFLYLIREVLYFLIRFRIDKQTSLYKGFNLYKKSCGDKKNIFLVLRELNTLSNYWKAFPDSYFRFGMFMSEWTDMSRMKSFIPQGAYARYSTDNKTQYNILIDDKILFHDIMCQYGLPVPERLFVFRDDIFRNGDRILSEKEVDSILSNYNDERIFVKKYTGGAASGISIFKRKSVGVYLDADGNVVSSALIRKKYSGQSFIFEKQIKQDKILAQFNQDTVNTIRVLTYKGEIISASVRFGGKGEFVDNVSAHGVACSIDIESGKLSEYGLRMYDIIKYYEHPDSHIKFADVYIPQWYEVRAVVKKSMKFLPYYKSVGYDVAISDNGPVIVEINTGAGVNLSQMGKQYGLARYFIN